VSAERRALLPALASRSFRLFWFGQTISLTGTWVQSVAQQWLVLQLTHSAFQVGLITTVQFLPVLILVLFAGAVADRVNKRLLLLLTQIVSMLLAALLGTLALFHVVQYWHILLIAAGLGTVNAFYVPARQSYVPELVDREHLLNAVALNSAIFNGARVVGPALGGLLYAATGPAWAFYINAASYLAVIAGLLMIRTVPRAVARAREPSGYRADLREGLAYIFGDARVLVILSLVGVASLFALNFTTLLPVFAKFDLNLNSGGFGILLTAQGAGSLVAAIALSLWNRQDRARRLIYGGAFTFLVLEIVFAFTRSFPVALALLFPIGFAMTICTTTANSRVLALTPSNLQGRVMSVYSLMFLGMTPFGSILAGAVAQRWGAPAAFVIGAAITLAFTAVVFIWRVKTRPMQSALETGQ
jgi:MFS family permease